ncbi:MAG: glycoside hydrolase [Bacteroidetes bacterium]|nr:glycoside hydrolase [Bacteroidota bacterium]
MFYKYCKSSFAFLFLTILALFPANSEAQINSFYNVRDFGAIGDGITPDTEAIRKAFDKCAAGGGTVLFPPGKYLTGSVKLESNVDVYIQAGALILGSANINDYEEFVPQLRSYNDYFLKHSLFYAEKAENISIRGEGIIDGQGSKFVITTDKKPDRYKNRPFIIRFVECNNVRIENVTMRNSAMWMQQYLACENLFIRGIKVYNHANKNNDMIDIDGCRNVVMSDCIGDTDDDALTLKSTSERITENVTITNCVLSSHCNAIKMGTESTGGFRNITISNIVVKPSDSPTKIYGQHAGISGITLGMVDGGILEGVIISNIRIDGPQVPIYMRLGNRARKHYPDAPQPGVGIFRNVILSDITATNIQSSIGGSITGIPGYNIENVNLNNIKIEYAGGGTIEDAAKKVDELEDHYPESTKWGTLPAYGFYVRHAENITFNNVDISYKEPDVRPAFIFDDAKKITLFNVSADADKNCEAVLKFINSSEININSFGSLSKTKLFAKFTGRNTNGIFLRNNNINNINNVFELGDGLSADIIDLK